MWGHVACSSASACTIFNTPPPPHHQPNMACMYPAPCLALLLQAALVSLAPLQYKAQRPLSGAVRITNPSDPAPTHRAASNLGARPATAPDGPLPSHRQPGGRYAAGAPGAAAFASLLTQSPSPASSTSMGFAGARPSTAAAAVNSSNSNSTSNPGLNSNHKLSASGTPTGAAALPAVAQAWPMPAGQGKEAILEARLLEDEEAGVGPAAVSAADRPGEVRVNKRGVGAVWPGLLFAGAASKGLIPSVSCACAVCRWGCHSVADPHLALCCLCYMLILPFSSS